MTDTNSNNTNSNNTGMSGNDHDLLIRIDEKLRILSGSFDNLRIDNEKRLNKIEQDYISRQELKDLKHESDNEHKDYEARIRRLERYGSIAVGALAVVQFLIAKI